MEHGKSTLSENHLIAEPAASVLPASLDGMILRGQDTVILPCGPGAALGPSRDTAAAIAHELSEALTAISNYSEASRVLLDRGGSDRLETARANLAKLQAQVARAGDILGRLRRLSGSGG